MPRDMSFIRYSFATSRQRTVRVIWVIYGRSFQGLPEDQKNFEEISKEQNSVGLIKELLLMLKHNKKWWLTPIILALLLFGALIIMGSSLYAPFI